MYTLSYTAALEDDGRLIRRVIRAKMGVSSHQLARAKAQGEVRLDGESVHADHIVHTGQTISVTLLDDAPACAPAPENAPIHILYEDDDLLVIDKSAPLATQSSPRQPDNTLENRLNYYFRAVPNYVFRPVNRLDKGTSGLMAVAKHAHAQMRMASQLHTPDFVREYLAITVRAPSPASGRIDLPIGKADGATVRREVREDGKPCATHYQTLRESGGRALLRLRLETGRTHQIRVHLCHIGCPVLGDFLYGEEAPDILPGRFALHSARMRFLHPLTNAPMEFEAPLPKELATLV